MKPTNKFYRNLSCQYITDALFRLMGKENFSDITVLQITQEAGVARRTFYLNYTSKEDILDQHYDILIRQYDEGFHEEMQDDLKKQGTYFFSFWFKNREYAKLLEKSGMLYMLMKRFHHYLSNTNIRKLNMHNEEAQEYASAYMVGGLFMLLETWLQKGFRETPEQLAEYFYILSKIG